MPVLTILKGCINLPSLNLILMRKIASNTLGIRLFAIAMIAIGFIHIFTHHFPTGLLPVPASLPYKLILACICGGLLILTGVFLFTKPESNTAAMAMAFIWLILFIAVHLPILLAQPTNGGAWAAALEVLAFFSAALMIIAINHNYKFLSLIACILFALTLVGFGILHWVYFDYILTLIPNWIPVKPFWGWVVLIAFSGAAISLLVAQWLRISMLLLNCMFLIWAIVLHIPRVVQLKAEPEWTSLFVAIAMAGIAQIAYSARKTSL